MQLIDELRAEHDLIEQVAGAFLTYVDARRRGGAQPGDGDRFLDFFRCYAGDFHHAREEETLFPALRDRAHLPADRGPIAVLTEDHRTLAARLAQIGRTLAALDAGRLPEPADGSAEPSAAAGEGRSDGEATLARLVAEYAHALWHHIDAENSVLLPESEARLRKHGAGELPSRPMSGAERAAEAVGRALIERYPPATDLSVVRGEGCVCCPAFGDRCGGVEREWWNEWEWEEFAEHLPSE